MLIRRHPEDSFIGNCPYHHDCAEGMAAGPAIAKRWGKPGVELTHEEAVWDLEAYYLAQVIANLLLILSTQKVILGGGVMGQKTLFPKIRQEVMHLLNGYIDKKAITENIHDLIVAPGLGSDAGLKGGLALILSSREQG
jgi:fructokinase